MAKNISTLGKYDQRRVWKLIWLVNHFDILLTKFTEILPFIGFLEYKIGGISLWNKYFLWYTLATINLWPFYSILFETFICQFNSSDFSPIMTDEVNEHLTRDQRPFLHPESLQTLQMHSSMCFSSVHLTHVLQGSGQSTGMAIAEAWFCAQWPIVVLFLRFVFVLLYGWKIQTWPIIRFLTESVTYWCQQDVQDLQQKYRPSTSKIRQYISLYTWGTFYPCVHQTHLEFLLLKSFFFVFHLTIEASPIWIFFSNYFLQFSSCGPWRVFSHSNSPPHRALGRYRPGCSWRSTPDIDTRPLPGRFIQFYVDWKFLIIALMEEMGIFTALALL